MRKKTPETQRRLVEEFPEISADKAEEIDIKIKAKVLTYQSDSINRDISALLQEEVKKYIKSKNTGKISKKCNKLANEQLVNNRIWILQENWYCLLAYFITIVTMILRVIELNQKMNDWISFAMYFIALGLWVGIVQSKKLMGIKAERFLTAFNHHAPSLIVVSSLLFYMTICTCTYRIVWWVIIVLSVAACVWFTCLWYKREMV